MKKLYLGNTLIYDSDKTVELAKNAEKADVATNADNANNADTVDNYHASVTPTANTIPVYDSDYALNYKSLKSVSFSAKLNTSGWYRIYNGTTVDNILLNIFSLYSNKVSNSHKLSINISSYDNYLPSITQLSGLNTSNVYDKIRVLTKHNSVIYIDIHYNVNAPNDILVNGIGNGTFQAPILSNNIPDGYAATEFNTGDGLRNSSDNGLVSDKLLTKQLTNEDLNNIKDNNFTNYFANGGNSCTNLPIVNGSSFNFSCYRVGLYYKQVLENVYNVTYMRTYGYPTANTWSSWEKLINSKDILSGYEHVSTYSLANLPTNKKVIVADINSDQTLGFNGTPPDGENITIIVGNASSSNVTINLSSMHRRNVDTITVEPWDTAKNNGTGAVEINVLYAYNRYYARAINYRD